MFTTFKHYLKYILLFVTPVSVAGTCLHLVAPNQWIALASLALIVLAMCVALILLNTAYEHRLILIGAMVFWASELAFQHDLKNLDTLLSIGFGFILFQLASYKSSQSMTDKTHS